MEKGKMIINGVEVGGSFGSATSVPYSNTNSGLEATNVQCAIDELNSNIKNIQYGTTVTASNDNVEYYSATVTFEKPFNTVPIVLTQVLYLSKASNGSTIITEVTQTGFTVRSMVASVPVMWVAIGE